MMLLTGWAIAACALWCWLHVGTLREVRRLRVLAREQPPAPAAWPRLSVVIAACNEADTLEQAVATLRAQDYPALEIVVVDDRSTDGTGAIVDRLAAVDARLVAAHVQRLPGGWLGKVHALHIGTPHATGDWLLYTDADVHFEPGALRRAVALAEAEGLDHLAVLPDARASGLLEDTVLAVFGGIFLRGTRAGRIGTPGSDAYTGVGAFNLVRRAALARTEGWPWLRMEIVDDVGLGLLLHRAGARAGFALGHGAVHLRWYPSLAAMVRGLEKNMFGFTARFSYARLVAAVLATWFMVPGPALALFAPGGLAGLALAGAASAALGASAVALHRKAGRRLGPLLLFPVGQLVATLILVRSALACWRKDGVDWRGTRYALADLRAGQRVKI